MSHPDRFNAARLAHLLALLPLVLATGALVGHALGVPLLASIRAEYRSMAPITAFAVLLLALALIAFGAGRPRLSRALAVVVCLGMLPVFASYAIHGVDRLSPAFAAFVFPASSWGGFTSRSAAISIVALGASILLDHRPRIADAASAVALVLSLVALLGYAYGVDDLQALVLFKNLAATTAISLFLLSIGVFCMRVETGWASIVASSYAAGGATRRQLVFLLWSPVIGGLAVRAVHGGRVGPAAAMAMLVIATVIPTALLVLRDGRRLIAVDEAKRSRDLQLAAVAEETQRRLAEQSEQLRAESAERAKAEALVYRAQRLEAVGQLTGGIAHDFNNLLMAVSGNVQLLERRLAPADPAMRYVGNLRSAVAKGTKVTQQLLAFARSQRLNIRPTAIGPVLVGARELIGHSLGPGVAIRIVPSPVELWAMCDGDQLELSILNLAVNARDAMPNGGTITIDGSVGTLAGEDAADPAAGPDAVAGRPCVRVRVADDGIGMPPEVAARAAEPFFTTKERGKGTGLGLAQVYGFVMQCEGEFRLQSAPGAGTTIELRFPLAEPPPAPPPEAAAPVAARAPAERLRVLVIDDDADVREVIVHGLAQAGYLVSEAHDGMSGLASLEQLAPAVAVIDFLMPGLDGAEVARLARDRHHRLPIVFVSGYSDTVALDAVAGTRVLRKPFDIQTLVRTVEDAIAG